MSFTMMLSEPTIPDLGTLVETKEIVWGVG